jgi:hypothetical protein
MHMTMMGSTKEVDGDSHLTRDTCSAQKKGLRLIVLAGSYLNQP